MKEKVLLFFDFCFFPPSVEKKNVQTQITKTSFYHRLSLASITVVVSRFLQQTNKNKRYLPPDGPPVFGGGFGSISIARFQVDANEQYTANANVT